MSLQSSVANYGGRVQPEGNIKQFVQSSNSVNWIYKKLNKSSLNRLTFITPQTKNPVLIESDLFVTGQIYNNTSLNTSDEVLKNNIYNIDEEMINKLVILYPVSFSYKNDKKNKNHFGFLAQDVEKIYPELVETNIMTGNKYVNYIELIPLLLAKIKKMDNEINELKESIQK